MTTPIAVLLAFAGWTLVVLLGSVGVYRWTRILGGRASLSEWRADLPQGEEWYRRAMRAHMNCVENLPVYGAVAFAAFASGASGALLDRMAIVFLAARICQSLVHIGAAPGESATALRFALYLVQVVCMMAMGIAIAAG